MPVQKDIIKGQTAEIRCTLKQAVSLPTLAIRYVISSLMARGLLRNDNGTVFEAKRPYPLTKDVFRLYYTSLSSDRQTIDVYGGG